MCPVNLLIALLVGSLVLYFVFGRGAREHYRDPIYLNRKKMLCDWYPRSNGSIYGLQSHVLSGFPYYDRAY